MTTHRPHTNTCNAVASALENIRDLEARELAQQAPDVQAASKSLIGWQRGEELDHVPNSGRIFDVARQWADLWVLEGTTYCDCDAKYVHVIARRWHRGHDTTAPARVLARVSDDTYVVEFLTPGPGSPQQIAFRSAMGVTIDDIPALEDMTIRPASRVTVTHPNATEIRNATRDVVDYLWEKEQEDYDEGQHEGPHVFESLRILSRSLDI